MVGGRATRAARSKVASTGPSVAASRAKMSPQKISRPGAAWWPPVMGGHAKVGKEVSHGDGGKFGPGDVDAWDRSQPISRVLPQREERRACRGRCPRLRIGRAGSGSPWPDESLSARVASGRARNHGPWNPPVRRNSACRGGRCQGGGVTRGLWKRQAQDVRYASCNGRSPIR